MMKKEIRTVDMLTPEGELFLRCGKNMPWNVYPRPHLKRDSFFCLNGEWRLAFDGYDGNITVPFVPQSILSGVNKKPDVRDILRYCRTFSLPEEFYKKGERVILHFGSVDQIARVSLNGNLVGTHVGGYAPFSFDVTDTLCDGENLLEVEVTDELEKQTLPYGKQCVKRGGMWYTPVSGIWQTVWLEAVPTSFIREIKIKTDGTGADIELDIVGDIRDGRAVLDGNTEFEIKDGRARIDVDEPVYWSPDSPHLYNITLCVGADKVSSYFALRTLTIDEVRGEKRLCLNGKPYFFHGLLDQGYFSDGIFLPADACGYERDIQIAKELGFNTLRKHIKIEPEIFYYLCDRLGMIVFQDAVNNSDYSFIRDTALPTVGIKRLNDKKMHKDKKTREAFLKCMEQSAKMLSFHPSVCYFTIFNEGWGQFDHAAVYDRLKRLDTDMFIDSVSGWFEPIMQKRVKSDIKSIHVYFKPVKIKRSERPVILSEFGGYSYKIEGHSFNLDKNYGYRTIKDKKEFEDAIEELYLKQIVPAINNGLCGAIYTQLSDVEDETNGMMTYDRKVIKAEPKKMREISKRLFEVFERKNI